MAIETLIWQLDSWDGKIVNMTDMWTVSGEDGSFLVRPSTQLQTHLTLTLWYRRRAYNISIRQRPDGRCALGTEKTNEQVCGSVLCTSLHKSLALHFTKPEGLLLWLLGWPVWSTSLPISVCCEGKSNEIPKSEKKKDKNEKSPLCAAAATAVDMHCVQLRPRQSACTVCNCGHSSRHALCAIGVEMLKCKSNNDRPAPYYYYWYYPLI